MGNAAACDAPCHLRFVRVLQQLSVVCLPPLLASLPLPHCLLAPRRREDRRGRLLHGVPRHARGDGGGGGHQGGAQGQPQPRGAAAVRGARAVSILRMTAARAVESGVAAGQERVSGAKRAAVAGRCVTALAAMCTWQPSHPLFRYSARHFRCPLRAFASRLHLPCRPPPLPCPPSLLSPLDARSLADEVGIMASLDHVHLVRLAAFYEDAGAYYIVTELMTGACGCAGAAAVPASQVRGGQGEGPGAVGGSSDDTPSTAQQWLPQQHCHQLLQRRRQR
jgi:hypothetical protein